MRPLLALIALALSLPAFAAEPPAPRPDRVDRKKGAPIAGVEIVSEDYKSVVFKRKGSDQTTRIDADDVLDIFRDDAPSGYINGRAALNAGDLVNAVASLKLALEQGKDLPWVREYANFYLGEAYRRSGKAAEAVSAYSQVLATKSDSRFLPRVRLALARAHLLGSQFGQAEQELNAFANEVDSKRLPLSYKIQANRLLAQTLADQDRWGEAANRYASVANEARGLAGRAEGDAMKANLMDLALEAQADQGACLVKAKSFGQARSLFANMASANRDDPLAQALADMGAGATLMGEGKLDEARVALARSAVLHFKADQVRPRALLLAARLQDRLAKENNEKGAGKLARAYLEDLIQFYPSSDQVEEARKLLDQLK